MGAGRWIMVLIIAAIMIAMGNLVWNRPGPAYVNPNQPDPHPRPRPAAPPPQVKKPGPPPPPVPAPPRISQAAVDAGLVDLAEVAPAIRQDVRYATANNFLGKAVYPAAKVLLARDAAERLARVQARLEADGLGLLVWDGYRPLAVQKAMWALVPDNRYVASPRAGSRHNRGVAVDCTLVDAQGQPVEMPTDFDDFSPRAGARAKASPVATANRARLQKAMTAEGFTIMPTEWWHFDAPGWQQAPVLDVPIIGS